MDPRTVSTTASRRPWSVVPKAANRGSRWECAKSEATMSSRLKKILSISPRATWCVSQFLSAFPASHSNPVQRARSSGNPFTPCILPPYTAPARPNAREVRGIGIRTEGSFQTTLGRPVSGPHANASGTIGGSRRAACTTEQLAGTTLGSGAESDGIPCTDGSRRRTHRRRRSASGEHACRAASARLAEPGPRS